MTTVNSARELRKLRHLPLVSLRRDRRCSCGGCGRDRSALVDCPQDIDHRVEEIAAVLHGGEFT